MTLCSTWRQNITESDLRLKSKDLHPLRQIWLPLTAMKSLGLPARIRTGMVSCLPEINRVRKTPSIKVLIVTAGCPRILEYLSASISHIYQKIALSVGLTRIRSSKSWEEAWATGTTRLIS